MKKLLLAALVLVAPVARAAPMVLVHDGYLLDSQDVPVSATDLRIEFAIWKDPGSTLEQNRVWRSGSCTVAVLRGLYSVALGGGATPGGCGEALTSNELPASEMRYLEVHVGGTPLQPRLRVGTVPSAVTATRAITAEDLACATPPCVADAEIEEVHGGKVKAGTLPWSALAALGEAPSPIAGLAATHDHDARYVRPADLGATGGAAVHWSRIDGLRAGPGLEYADGQIGVTYGGNGSAASVARSDHSHAIPAGAVGTGEIANGAITTAKIGDLAVTTGKIADGAITPGKLSTAYLPLAGGRVTGGLTVDGTLALAGGAAFNGGQLNGAYVPLGKHGTGVFNMVGFHDDFLIAADKRFAVTVTPPCDQGSVENMFDGHSSTVCLYTSNPEVVTVEVSFNGSPQHYVNALNSYSPYGRSRKGIKVEKYFDPDSNNGWGCNDPGMAWTTVNETTNFSGSDFLARGGWDNGICKVRYTFTGAIAVAGDFRIGELIAYRQAHYGDEGLYLTRTGAGGNTIFSSLNVGTSTAPRDLAVSGKVNAMNLAGGLGAFGIGNGSKPNRQICKAACGGPDTDADHATFWRWDVGIYQSGLSGAFKQIAGEAHVAPCNGCAVMCRCQ